MKFTLNQQEVEIQGVSPETPLLYVLRNDMQLNGPKFGCGLGECGACAVLIDGKVARSCSVPVSTAPTPVPSCALLGRWAQPPIASAPVSRAAMARVRPIVEPDWRSDLCAKVRRVLFMACFLVSCRWW